LRGPLREEGGKGAAPPRAARWSGTRTCCALCLRVSRNGTDQEGPLRWRGSRMGRGGEGPGRWQRSRARPLARRVECARSCGGQGLVPEESVMVIEEATNSKRLVQVRPAPDLAPLSPVCSGGVGGMDCTRPARAAEVQQRCCPPPGNPPPPPPLAAATIGGDCGTCTQGGSVAADEGRPQYPSPRGPR